MNGFFNARFRRTLVIVSILALLFAGSLSLGHAYHCCEDPMDCPLCQLNEHNRMLSCLSAALLISALLVHFEYHICAASVMTPASRPLVALHVRLND